MTWIKSRTCTALITLIALGNFIAVFVTLFSSGRNHAIPITASYWDVRPAANITAVIGTRTIFSSTFASTMIPTVVFSTLVTIYMMFILGNTPNDQTVDVCGIKLYHLLNILDELIFVFMTNVSISLIAGFTDFVVLCMICVISIPATILLFVAEGRKAWMKSIGDFRLDDVENKRAPRTNNVNSTSPYSTPVRMAFVYSFFPHVFIWIQHVLSANASPMSYVTIFFVFLAQLAWRVVVWWTHGQDPVDADRWVRAYACVAILSCSQLILWTI